MVVPAFSSGSGIDDSLHFRSGINESLRDLGIQTENEAGSDRAEGGDVQDLLAGFGIRVSGFGFRDSGFGFRDSGFGIRV